MEGVNPIQYPGFYDVVILAAQVSPGIARVSGFARTYGWEQKKAKGATGAKVEFQGEELATGEVELSLWTPEHFTAWDDFRALLAKAQDPKKVTALDILHPALTDLGIFSVVVTSIGQLERQKGGMFKVRFSLLEYRQPTPASGSPKGSKANGQGQKQKSYGTQYAGTASEDQESDLVELLNETTSDIEKLIAKVRAEQGLPP